MKLSLFTAAIFLGYGEATKVKQIYSGGSFLEHIASLELSQAEAATMTEAEIEARATVIVDTFLSNAVESEVSAEAKAEFYK